MRLWRLAFLLSALLLAVLQVVERRAGGGSRPSASAVESAARHAGSGLLPTRDEGWRAARAEEAPPTPWACGDCVLDPLIYPDTYCAARASLWHNGSTAVLPTPARLQKLEPYTGVQQASFGEVLDALPRDAVVGVMGDSLMQQMLDAAACDLRRDGRQAAASFLRWDRVFAEAGRMHEDARMYRYNYGGPVVGEAAGALQPRFFVLVQMRYNEGEVRKMLNASDVVVVNYGLHYCQPARLGADARCTAEFDRHAREMRALLALLQAWVGEAPRRRRAILQETAAQHFPQSPAACAAGPDAPPTGDWETRAFFPRLGPEPPTPCRCEPSAADGVPLRTQLLRNLTRGAPAVRVLPLHALLAPRYGWHHQDCKVRERARLLEGGGPPAAGCDCTHFCFSPTFWRVYFGSLLEAVR